MADRIRELAREHRVPLVEEVPALPSRSALRARRSREVRAR